MGTLGTAYYIGAASDGAECAYCSSHDGEITNFHDASFTALSLTCERWTLVGIPADVGSGVGSNWHTLLQAGLEEVMLSYIHHQTRCSEIQTICSSEKAYQQVYTPHKLKAWYTWFTEAQTRWNNFVLHGDKLDSVAQPQSLIPKQSHKPRHTKKGLGEYPFIESIHASEKQMLQGQSSAHKFEVTLGLPSCTDEKHKLFKAYQEHVHQDQDTSSYTFRKFLAKTPLQQGLIPYRSTPSQHMPREYGTYHQLYHLDGKLIAMAVLDVLPSCVSSVYFIYDPAWERYSLGKLSILREITLVNEIHNAGISSHESLYLGYYVHDCQKMKYKAEYSPSHLLDPEDYTWWPIEICQKQLDSIHYACFSQPEHSLQTPPGRDPLPIVPDNILETLPILKPNETGEYKSLLFDDGLSDVEVVRVTLSRMVHSLGIDIARNMNFVVEDWK